MQTQSQVELAYANSQTSVRTARGVELEAFSSITRKLASSIEDSAQNYSQFAASLHNNRKLWIHLASSVADKNNRLSKELRGGIFSLAEFVDRKTSELLKSGGDAQVLLDINSEIMRGLRGASAIK